MWFLSFITLFDHSVTIKTLLFACMTEFILSFLPSLFCRFLFRDLALKCWHCLRYLWPFSLLCALHGDLTHSQGLNTAFGSCLSICSWRSELIRMPCLYWQLPTGSVCLVVSWGPQIWSIPDSTSCNLLLCLSYLLWLSGFWCPSLTELTSVLPFPLCIHSNHCPDSTDSIFLHFSYLALLFKFTVTFLIQDLTISPMDHWAPYLIVLTLLSVLLPSVILYPTTIVVFQNENPNIFFPSSNLSLVLWCLSI